MIPLLKLELRRQRPMVVKMAALTAVVCAVFYLAGKRAPAELLAAVAGSGLGAVLIVPMGISRDKMEGTLEFLCGLPVEPRAIAASRFAVMAVVATPWAVAIGAVSMMHASLLPLHPLAVLALSWLVMLALGACGVALMAVFDLETLLGAPMIAVVLIVVLVPRLVRAALPNLTGEMVLRLAERPAAPAMIAAVAVVALAAIGVLAFGAATRGFAAYRSDSARR